MLAMEIGHLQVAADVFKKHENRDPEEIIGTDIILPCHFESQKAYVKNILENEVDKRLDENMDYTTIDKLPDNWASYDAQNAVNGKGAPTEKTIQLIKSTLSRDIVCADKKLVKKQPELLEKGLERKAQAPDTVSVAEYERMTEVEIYDFEEE